MGEFAIKLDGKHKKVAKLDIYADEDHVAMQDGSNKQLPLVVVSEGKEAGGERQKLINPIAFQGCDMSPETFFDGISAYLREEYDIDNCEIVLHSDGAKRMKKVSNSFMNVTYVMDDFHIKKHLKSLCAGEIGRKYALALRTCVECNGGKVSSKDVGKRRNENFELDSKNRRRRKAPPIPKVVELYQEYAQNQIGKIFDGKYDWSVFEKEDNTNGKVTGLKVLMKAYSKAKVVS